MSKTQRKDGDQPKCRCGHRYSEHFGRRGDACASPAPDVWKDLHGPGRNGCECPSYSPQAQP